MVTKSVSLTRKRELEQPDQVMIFMRGVLQFFIEYKTRLLIAFGVFLALICVLIGFRYYSNIAEKKAFSELDKCMYGYKTLVNGKGDDLAYLNIEKDFQAFLEKYSNRVAGKIAGVFYANICYKNGNYDKAISLYENVLENFDKNTQPYKNLILSGLGYSHEGTKDYNKAVKYFEMIVSGTTDFLKDEALFNLGRLYADKGESAKSTKAFETIISDHSYSMYVDLVKEKLAI